MRLKGETILNTLNHHGYEAYFVGGCVRDYLLGKEPNDIDITTNARPAQVEALFEQTIPTGKDYGTITVISEGESYEVTTFRLESDYDGRRPKVVKFGDSLEEDLIRRDFTINAMAMDSQGKVYDFFGGKSDLENRVIRFVGNPLDRIREDKIRLFRYVRFMAQYHLSPVITDEILKNIKIDALSAERIREEFNKILLSDKPSAGIRKLNALELLPQFFPELCKCSGFLQHHPAHFEDVFDHTMTVLDLTEPVLTMRLAALCHDLGKVETLSFDEAGIGHFYGHQKNSALLAEQWMTRLKYATKEIEAVKHLVYHHMRVYDTLTTSAARRLIFQIGKEQLTSFFALQVADTSACQGDRDLYLSNIAKMQQLCQTLIDQEQAFELKDLQIDGYALMELGYAGKEIGRVKALLMEAVLNEVVKNEHEDLKALAQNIKSELIEEDANDRKIE